MQRALSASELTGPPMKKIQNQGLDTLQEKGSPKPGSLLKAQAAAVTKETKAAKGPDLDPKASPTPVQKAPLCVAGDSQKPTDKISEPGLNPTKITPDTKGELGNPVGLSGPKTGPDASKTTESVTGKMFGFGSSIFSSASTLVSSAVQEVSSTTPPGSRKMSAGPKISPRSTPTASPKMSPAREPKTLSQKPEQGRKPEESHQSKEDKAPLQLPRASAISQTSSKGSKATCPLCKVELNMSSKDPPNYNTCTECKTTVCSQCGFNPIPIGKVSNGIQ